MLATAGTTKYFEDLKVGQEASMSRVVTEADIVAYAALSGDYNPVHTDPEYAAKTVFKARIAHGILSAGYISALFGMKLPGPGSIYISQTLNFKAPVKIGDTLSIYTEIERVGRSSITLCIEAWATRARYNKMEKVTEGTFIMVALDEDGQPKAVPAE